MIQIMTLLPNPDLFLKDASRPLRWGVIGAGGIAETWADTVNRNSLQQIVAVASRTPGKAASFARKFNIPVALDSYEALVSRDDVDAIYVATLPDDHFAHCLMVIAAGKHLLCEKPITMDAGQARQIFSAAKAQGVLAMEAMWTKYLPQMTIARQLINSGALGEIDLVISSFCQANLHIPRLFTPGHGNPLIDMGIYPIALSNMALGNPVEITANGVIRENGVDEEVHAFMRFSSGARSNFVVSARTSLPHQAGISGSEAVITFGANWFTPTSITLQSSSLSDAGQTWTDTTGIAGHAGLVHQVNAMAQYVEQGLRDSPIHSAQQAIDNIETALRIGELLGIRFHA